MGVVFGLLAGITYGASDFIGGLASRRSPVLAVVVISQLVGLISLGLLMPLLPRGFPNHADLMWGSLAGVSGAVGITLLYRGLAVGRMTLVSPVTAVIGALVPFVVGLLIRERPSSSAIFGVAIALLAVVLVSTPEKRNEPGSDDATKAAIWKNGPQASPSLRSWAFQPGLIEAAISGIGIGFFYGFLAQAHAQAGMWPLAGARLSSVGALSVLAFLSKRSLAPREGDWSPIALAGILDISANALYVLATHHGLLAIVAVLASLYPASTVLLARIVLKERLSALQFAGVGCALVAIALIASGS